MARPAKKKSLIEPSGGTKDLPSGHTWDYEKFREALIKVNRLRAKFARYLEVRPTMAGIDLVLWGLLEDICDYVGCDCMTIYRVYQTGAINSIGIFSSVAEDSNRTDPNLVKDPDDESPTVNFQDDMEVPENKKTKIEQIYASTRGLEAGPDGLIHYIAQSTGQLSLDLSPNLVHEDGGITSWYIPDLTRVPQQLRAATDDLRSKGIIDLGSMWQMAEQYGSGDKVVLQAMKLRATDGLSIPFSSIEQELLRVVAGTFFPIFREIENRKDQTPSDSTSSTSKLKAQQSPAAVAIIKQAVGESSAERQKIARLALEIADRALRIVESE